MSKFSDFHIFEEKKKELEHLIAVRKHQQYLKNGTTEIKLVCLCSIFFVALIQIEIFSVMSLFEKMPLNQFRVIKHLNIYQIY